MDRFKALFKNTAIFAISQFASKILVFLLLPLYTSYMSTAEYGSADLVQSTVNLLLPIFTVEITSAVMRYSIENTDNAKKYYVNGMSLVLIGFVALLAFIPLFRYMHLFDGYLYLFYIFYIANAVYNLLSYYSRALGEIKLVGFAGILNTVVLLVCNILFLKVFGMGLKGYLVSYILGFSLSVVLFAAVLRKSLTFKLFRFDKQSLKQMVSYSLPLVPNNISWWGVSSANKYVIYGYLNESVLGIYSAGLKVPSIVNTIQAIVAESLVLSVFEEYKKEEVDEEYFSQLYRMYSTIMILFVSAIIVGSKIIASILFSNEFFSAWEYVPLLCVPSVWGALSGYLGSFYAAEKKNNGMFISTALGGIISLTVSFLTVKHFGVYGIITGNIFAYFVIWLYRWIDVRKFVKIKANMVVDCICWLALIAQSYFTMHSTNNLRLYLVNIAFFIGLLLINGKTTLFVVKKVKEVLLAKIKGRN